MLLQKLREESRAVFLQRKSRELLDNEELQVKNTHTHLKVAGHSALHGYKHCRFVNRSLLCRLSAESVVSAR